MNQELKELKELKEAMDKLEVKIEENQKKCLELEKQGKLAEAQLIYNDTAKSLKELQNWVSKIGILINNRIN